MNNAMNYGQAIEALEAGYCVARLGWNGKNMFVCKQVSSIINGDIIPKMQSLPQSAKDILGSEESINYSNQMIIVNTNTRKIDSWIASSSDTFAKDYYVVYKK